MRKRERRRRRTACSKDRSIKREKRKYTYLKRKG
jgi:hypothetical protein